MRRVLSSIVNRWWKWILSVGVRVKIMGIVLGLTLLFGSAVILYVRASLSESLSHNLEDMGASIAGGLAAQSTDLILTNNVFALHELVRDTLENNEDVRYAFILDPHGNVVVHTFPSGLPPTLASANSVNADQRDHLEVFDTEEGTVRDIAVPIFGGRAGVARVGMSDRRLNASIEATTQQLILITLLVSALGVAAAFLLTRVMTRPIFDLVGATRAVARGDLSQRVVPWASDEIGQLTSAFNVMTDDLDRAYRAMLQRNRELAALNTISTALSGPMALNETLQWALDTTLEATNLQVGWISLLQNEHGAAMVCWRGMADEIAKEEGKINPVECACHSVLQAETPQVLAPLTGTCPIAGLGLPDGGCVDCHAAVPLISQGQVVGLMNLATADAQVFREDDLKLLAAIGREIGAAIEKARLWEALRGKERVRGQLLDKVIRAQEEERKRLARELHDETGQSLTSLLVGLKLVEEAPSLEESRQHARLVRSLAGDVLDDVRALARDLRPSVLDDVGLVAALERYTGEYAQRFNVAVDFQVVGFDNGRLSPQHEIALYRIVQEALTNVAKYARAQNVSVLLEQRNHSIVAIVEDDGCGFEAAKLMREHEDGKHLGLLGMKERAELLGGKLTIESKPGEGTTVFAQLPVNDQIDD